MLLARLYDTIALIATQAEARAIERSNLSRKGRNLLRNFSFLGNVRIFSHTAVGHIAVNFGEGKVVGLPMIQESPNFRTGSCQQSHHTFMPSNAWRRAKIIRPADVCKAEVTMTRSSLPTYRLPSSTTTRVPSSR